MSHHWRADLGRTEIMRAAGEHDVEYFSGWALSGLGTAALVLIVWHLGI